MEHRLAGFRRDVAYLERHRIVVIVNRDLRKQTCLLSGTVVLGIELTVRDGGSLEVRYEREGESIVEVGRLTAVSVVEVGLYRYGVKTYIRANFVSAPDSGMQNEFIFDISISAITAPF